jgi:hypothetical protein
MQPSRKRCPSPNSLARLEPKPARVLEVNKGDVSAFREVLEAQRLQIVRKLVAKAIIKEEHILSK